MNRPCGKKYRNKTRIVDAITSIEADDNGYLHSSRFDISDKHCKKCGGPVDVIFFADFKSLDASNHPHVSWVNVVLYCSDIECDWTSGPYTVIEAGAAGEREPK